MYRPALAYKADYLYEAWYDVLDYAYAYEWFRSHTPAIAGACSTVRKGNLIGRNLDWTYDESAEFIVHAGGTAGVANAIPSLTDAFVKSGADSELYKIVPFMLADGMNRHGLFVSTLVVPTDKGDNSVVQPMLVAQVELCTLMLPRFILDRFDSAEAACHWIMRYAKLYHPKTLQDMEYDQHFVIADNVDTYCMEFVEGEYVVYDIADAPYVTNFHLSGVVFNADGSVNTPASGEASANQITPNGSGLERYNLINAHTGSIQEIMRDLTFTRAYQSSANPAVPRWDTEFVGNGRTVDTPTAGYDSAQAAAARMYLDRSRALGETWQTVHSVIYDVQDKKLHLYAQEQFDTQWEVSIMPEQTHVQRLRGSTAGNDNYTGLDGEFSVNRTSYSIRVHDGVTPGGHGQVYAAKFDELPDSAPVDLHTGALVVAGDGPIEGGGGDGLVYAGRLDSLPESGVAPDNYATGAHVVVGSGPLGNDDSSANADAGVVALKATTNSNGAWTISGLTKYKPVFIMFNGEADTTASFAIQYGCTQPIGQQHSFDKAKFVVLIPNQNAMILQVSNLNPASAIEAYN